MNSLEQYYNILEIEIGASKEKIKKAYRKLAHLHHPDKGGDEKMMKKINEAYAMLMNPPVPQIPQTQYSWSYYTYNYSSYVGTGTNAWVTYLF